jgi:hypothetical protein
MILLLLLSPTSTCTYYHSKNRAGLHFLRVMSSLLRNIARVAPASIGGGTARCQYSEVLFPLTTENHREPRRTTIDRILLSRLAAAHRLSLVDYDYQTLLFGKVDAGAEPTVGGAQVRIAGPHLSCRIGRCAGRRLSAG